MKVLLAGYNADSTVLEELKKLSPFRQDLTPETLSAAYARISRDPRSADELRAIARAEVEQARRSNQTIIFKMGHHSVAEHAVFNFDIIGVSRLAIEEIEKFRLGSFTEKSQRYIKLKDDFVLPQEIKKAGKEKLFVDMIKTQNSYYHKLYAKLKPYFFNKYPDLAKSSRKHHLLEGWAKEDARYVVSLATQGQLGMTMNARSLEYLIRKFASNKLEEIKELNQEIHDLVKEVAPSIILFTETNDFDARTYENLATKARSFFKLKESSSLEKVKLVDYTPNADIKLTAALLHSSSSQAYPDCLKTAEKMNLNEKKEFLKTAFKHLEFYDTVLREFEYVDLMFDLIISATCFAQLKRHRMATLTSQPYDPELGVTVPPSIEEVGSKADFLAIIKKTTDVYKELKKNITVGAEYLLTNAHRKRVLLKVNAREFYHISRLREDPTAQWDIRLISEIMSKQAKKYMPLTFMLLGGKADYPEIYAKIFGQSPKLKPPSF